MLLNRECRCDAPWNCYRSIARDDLSGLCRTSICLYQESKIREMEKMCGRLDRLLPWRRGHRLNLAWRDSYPVSLMTPI